jgi:hypothetical protein
MAEIVSDDYVKLGQVRHRLSSRSAGVAPRKR